MVPEGIEFALFLQEWLATSVKSVNFMPKGAISKKEKKKSYFIVLS